MALTRRESSALVIMLVAVLVAVVYYAATQPHWACPSYAHVVNYDNECVVLP